METVDALSVYDLGSSSVAHQVDYHTQMTLSGMGWGERESV